MSKTPKSTPRANSNGMRAEYALDYSKARPNRFAGQMNRDVVAVVLEPDVASVFGSSAKVNALLRSVIAALPSKPRPARVRGHRRKAG
jgi:hypothetical protein